MKFRLRSSGIPMASTWPGSPWRIGLRYRLRCPCPIGYVRAPSYQMAIMGASALGAALWGQVATVGAIHTALLSAAASGIPLMLLAVRFVTDSADEEPDMSPARAGWAARPSGAPQEGGRVVTTIEYLIDPSRAQAFVLVMQESRRTRLSEGAIGWEPIGRHRRAGPVRRGNHR
jgi:hypothetical protein